VLDEVKRGLQYKAKRPDFHPVSTANQFHRSKLKKLPTEAFLKAKSVWL
jgi:hypothetical protein